MIRFIDRLAERIHLISTSKGFKPPSLANLPEKLMLSVSELSEALEEHRSGRPLVWAECDSCKTIRTPADWPTGPRGWECHGLPLKPEGILTEIGDSVIRNLHMMHSLILEAEESGGYSWSIEKILNVKIDYNAGRPAMHGRNY